MYSQTMVLLDELSNPYWRIVSPSVFSLYSHSQILSLLSYTMRTHFVGVHIT